MARVFGRLVFTGNKDGVYTMNVEFSDTTEPHPLRTNGGYYVGKGSSAEMIKEIKRRAEEEIKRRAEEIKRRAEGLKPGSVRNVAAAGVDEVRSVESESSSESPKPTTRGSSLMDTAKIDCPPGARYHKAEDSSKQEIALKMEDTIEKKDAKREVYSRDSPEGKEIMKAEGFAKGASVKEEGSGQGGLGKGVLERSPAAVGLKPLLGPFAERSVRAVGRAPIGPLRRDVGSADEIETEVEEVDDYFVVGEDGSKPVSLCLLPLELEKGLTIGGSDDTTELSVRGKSNVLDIMRPISAWKLEFLDNLSFQILVKITQKNDTKWVKLGKPRARFKEKLEDVFLVARVLALLKMEPQASEDRAWNYLLQGDFTPDTLRDLLRLRCTLMEQFINLDPALKEANAQKTLLALLDREKEANPGKRLVSDRDSLDEGGTQPVKKAKIGYVSQKSEKLATRVGSTSYSMGEDVSMDEFDSEEEYYDGDGGEADDSDEEFGDSFCIFCDDGGTLLCCDGPCMRSFHATKLDGEDSGCRTLGLTEAEVAGLVGRWLCKNCTYKQHQCYVCGELGASAPDEASGKRQEVFVCNVACCGRFYHPKCIASKLSVTPSGRETMAEKIQNGKESFTCSLHACRACRKGENREVEDLILAKCRRCPTAWHKQCLPRDICFEEEAKVLKLDIRAWTFGERNKQLICYCKNHAIISGLGTPSRKHVKFGLSPEEKAKRVEEVEKAKKNKWKVVSVTKGPAPYGAKTSLTAASMGKSADKKYPSADLLAKPRTDWFSGSSSLPSSSISKTALKKSEESLLRIVQSVVTRSKQRVTEESVKNKHEFSLPGIYKPRKTGNKEFMKMGMVESILEAAKAAMEKIKHNRSNEGMTICDRQTVQTVWHEEDRLRTYLSPTLFGRRYTSYGRHFTKIQKLEKVVEILQPYILDRDTIVDFSCGDNSFCRLLREDLSKVGKPNCQFKNFDLFPSNDSFGFEQKDWFEVGLTDCGPGDNLVIGLNPPFAFVEKFVSHALGMNPRLLVLIVPPMKKNLEHLGYECLVDDDTLMAEKSFYLPGSVNEKNTECLEQGNNVAPHFFIFCSKKFSSRGMDGFAEAPERPSTGSLMIRKSEKPAKPPPLSVPAVNIFIPSVPPRPQPGQAPNQKAPGKVAVALKKRDPRQPPQVPRQAVSGFVDVGAPEDGEEPSPQGQRLFMNNNNNNNMRPPWRREELPPPPPLPPYLVHMRGMPPRHHPGFPPPFFPRPYHLDRPDEYSPHDPRIFSPGSSFMHPVRPPHDGFYRGPRPPEEFYAGPRPPRQREFRPEENDGSFGGWIE